jgi:hypothetical protein
MTTNNVLITGTPRSGTTMTCHLLNMVPDTVALHEPMQTSLLKGPDGPAGAVARFCDEQRQSILERGIAFSKQVGGVVPANPVGERRSESGLRQREVAKGEIAIDKDLSPDFTLAVKHCGAFAATLDRLVERFPVYAIVRNPLAMLASWSSVDFHVQRGRVPVAEGLDRELKSELAAIDDVLDRQIYILAWFHKRIRCSLPEEAIIRYEAIVETGGRALAIALPAAAALDEPLQSQNTSGLYDRERMLRIGERLLKSEGAHWESYSKESVEHLLEELTAEDLIEPAAGAGDAKESSALP